MDGWMGNVGLPQLCAGQEDETVDELRRVRWNLGGARRATMELPQPCAGQEDERVEARGRVGCWMDVVWCRERQVLSFAFDRSRFRVSMFPVDRFVDLLLLRRVKERLSTPDLAWRARRVAKERLSAWMQHL